MAMGRKWYVKRCAIGSGVAIVLYLLLLSLCALITTKGVIGEERMKTCVWLCAATASLAGCGICAGKTVRRGIMMVCCGAVLYLTMLLLGFLIGGTTSSGSALTMLLPVTAGVLAAYLLLGRKDSKKRGRRTRHTRR